MARFCRAFLATVLFSGWVAGCTSKPMTTKQVKPPPPDPLLMSKKPIEGRPNESDQESTAHFEPMPPSLPARPALAADGQLASPGWRRDPITGVQIGFEPTETNAWSRPAVQTTANGQP